MRGVYLHRMFISLITPLKCTFTGVTLYVAIHIPEELVTLM